MIHMAVCGISSIHWSFAGPPSSCKFWAHLHITSFPGSFGDPLEPHAIQHREVHRTENQETPPPSHAWVKTTALLGSGPDILWSLLNWGLSENNCKKLLSVCLWFTENAKSEGKDIPCILWSKINTEEKPRWKMELLSMASARFFGFFGISC